MDLLFELGIVVISTVMALAIVCAAVIAITNRPMF